MYPSLILTLFLAVQTVFSAVPPGAVLTRNGKAASVILVPDADSRGSREAAELLQKTIAKMTGATVPIEHENRAGGAPSRERVWLSVGDTRFARSKGIHPEALNPEEIRVLAAPEYVIVTGNTSPAGDSGRDPQQGPYFAAVELLERLGVRWLWPGEAGEVIPKTATLSVGPLEYAFTPPVVQRHLRFGPDRGNGAARYGIKIREAGLDWGDWPQHLRLGYGRRITAGHNFGDWYGKYFKTHPEYFAVGEDGKTYGWMNDVNRSKLCVSNPGVLEEVVNEARAYYAGSANPAGTCFSLSPTDNQAGHCMCENCRRMDALDGPRESLSFWTGKNTETRKVIDYVSLTDRYLTFWNRVAERVEQACPRLLLSGMAYGVYRHPPVHAVAHKNLVITYVGGDYTNDALRRSCVTDWDAWSAKVKKMMFRPNLMKEGFGFPLLWPLRMADDLKHFIRNGMIATDIANIHGHWATQGLNYYVLAKILWNPALDARAVIDDYCDRGFGPASPAVKKYYFKLIQLTDQLAAYNGEREKDVDAILARSEATATDRVARAAARNTGVSAYETVYTPDVMKELAGYLAEARLLAAAEPAVLKRIEFLALGFQYATLDLRMKQARARYLREPEASGRSLDLLRALVDLEEWRKRNAASPAVGTVVGYYWFWREQLAETPAMNFAPVVLPQKLSGGDYRLEILAFSHNKRIAKMQLSADGRQWSAERPYEPRIPWQGKGQVYVRFYLEAERGAEWSKPVRAEL